MGTYRLVKVDKLGGGGPALICKLRDPEGNSKVVSDPDFRPYFWSAAKERWDADALSLDGTPVVRREMKSTKGVYLQRDRYDYHCEADIPYPRRWMIDRDVYAYVTKDLERVEETPEVELRRVYWDIEVAEERFVLPEQTGHIVMLTFYDQTADHKVSFVHHGVEARTEERTYEGHHMTCPWEVHFLPTEQETLEHAASWVRSADPDLLIGFNSSGYDWPMFLGRGRKIGANVQAMSDLGKVSERNLPGTQLVDIYEIYLWSRPTKERDSSLQAVAERNGFGTYPELGSKVYDYYRAGRIDELLQYNALDVEAAAFIDDVENLTSFAQVVQDMAGADDIMTVTQVSVITDILCLREARRRCTPLPSKGHLKGEKGDYKGGEVMEPKRGGVIDKVAVYDFSRMFPNLILQLNISPETLVEEEADWVSLGEGLRGYKFSQDKVGILPSVVKRMFEVRDYCEARYQETKSEVWEKRIVASKFLCNGCYGYTGHGNSRLYDRRVAETVTGASRCLIQLTANHLESQGLEVIYGDSDSCMIPTQDPWETEESARWAVEQACKDMDINAVKIDFEKWYHTFLLVPGKKKRYCGYVVWEDGEWLADPKLEIKGFEYRRSDAPEILVEAQADIFDLMLKRKPRDKVLRTVLSYMWRIGRGEVPVEKLANAPQLSKDPHEYGHYGPALAAKFSNTFFDLGIRAGDRVLPVYVSGLPDGVEHYKAVGIRLGDSLPEGVVPDYRTMAEKAIGKKFADLFDAIGWRHEADRVRNAWNTQLTEFR